jgi:hypothetical protein
MGNGAFLAVVAVPRINNLRAVNTLNSSTPAASTILSALFISTLRDSLLLCTSDVPFVEVRATKSAPQVTPHIVF